MTGDNKQAQITALIIDDNPDDRILVKRQLQEEFRLLLTFEVYDMAGFYQALERGQFDVAITDYELKWSNGLFVSRAVKARYPDCPVVMFTNSGDEEVAVKALKLGVDDYVLKRKGYKPLSKTVQKVLEWSDVKAGKKPRCLLLTEGETERQQLKQLIRQHDESSYIVTFTSWEEADKNLSNATTYLYDVLITNTIENHGLDLVRRAVAIHSTLPVVSIVDPRFSTAYYQAGAWAVIPKPVVEDVFLAWLQRAVRISSLGRKVTRQKEALERYARSLEQSTHFSTSRAVDDHERKNR